MFNGVSEGARTLGHQGHNLVLYQLSYTHQKSVAMLRNQPLIVNLKMARQEGFEPSAYGLEVRCSIQLSYWRAATEDRVVSGAGRRRQAEFLTCTKKFCK